MITVSDYYFHPVLFLRTPVSSYRYYRTTTIADILEDRYFKISIFLASRSLYREIEKKDFVYNCLTAREKNSLQKYFNRMCYRPTPFGLFAGFSVVHWGVSDCSLVLRDQLKLYGHASYSQLQAIVEKYLNNQNVSLPYMMNDTLYQIGNEYRYIRYEQPDQESKRKFFIDSFESSNALDLVLSFCRKERKKTELSELMSKQFSINRDEALFLIEDLIEKQIIVPTIQPNLIGKSYLQRILDLTGKDPATPVNIQTILLSDGKRSIPFLEERKSPKELFGAIPMGRASVHGEASTLYVNLEKPNVLGCLDRQYQEKILQGLNCVNRLVPAHKPPGLADFTTKFKEKYDRRAVPLLEALDPEVGIDYESLSESFSSSVLLRDIEIDYPISETMSVQWNKVQQFLFKKWKAANDSILLTNEDLAELPAPSKDYSLPPSLSVLFRPCANMVYIEQAGGVTATALVGRFTFFNDAIYSACKEIVRVEETANPRVIFAEVAHLSDTHVANIEQRRRLRQYEITVLTGSDIASKYQIPLSDLWVTVSDNRMVLWSQRHKRQVIPRLTSAFNYKRSELAVFRFLCDLQYQGLKANVHFDLSQFFPGLVHYPRIQYESTILQLATWHIGTGQIRHIVNQESPSKRTEYLRKLADECQWPRIISMNRSDHQLVIDIESEEDCNFLVNSLKKHQLETIIKEFPFTATESSVNDCQGNPYINQFVAFLSHKKEVYPFIDHPFGKGAGIDSAKRKVVPGKDWLYIKIYCRPYRSEELLVRYILPIANSLTRRGLLEKWFFLRYTDPDYHLRVRFRIDMKGFTELMSLLERNIEHLVQAGIVSGFQIDVYERELERYSPNLIEEIENVFCRSSSLVVNSLKENAISEAHYSYYNQAFSVIDYVLNTFGYSIDNKVTLLRTMYSTLYSEFHGSRKLNNQLKRKFRELQTSSVLDISPLETIFTSSNLSRLLVEFKRSLVATVDKAKDLNDVRRHSLVSDLIHMYLNRLLTEAHHKQELIMYFCLYKYYASLVARSKSGRPFASQ